jgi:hypothetical protein
MLARGGIGGQRDNMTLDSSLDTSIGISPDDALLHR